MSVDKVSSSLSIIVLNQSVLLRGVNDRVETLAELSRELVDRRVMPYYLHQLDRVAGADYLCEQRRSCKAAQNGSSKSSQGPHRNRGARRT